MTLRPNKTDYKTLLSTTSQLVGEFESSGMLLTHAWPDFLDRSFAARRTEGPASRCAFVFAFHVPEKPAQAGDIVEDFSHVGDALCACLTVLFGKRFDHHGLIEGRGIFHVPNLVQFGHLCRHNLPHNSHSPRPDFAVPLNLAEVSRLLPLLTGSLDKKFSTTFHTCAKFYLQAIRNAESEPEVAYLHLITAGEILSNHYEYEKTDLLDDTIKAALAIIENIPTHGPKIARLFSGRLRQIKRRFLITFENLIDDDFFQRSESSDATFSFHRESFMERLAAAYDLRSRYVHTGIPFGHWASATQAGQNSEILCGTPVVRDDPRLGKLLELAPTLIGLERIIRYALFKFADENGLPMTRGASLESSPA